MIEFSKIIMWREFCGLVIARPDFQGGRRPDGVVSTPAEEDREAR